MLGRGEGLRRRVSRAGVEGGDDAGFIVNEEESEEEEEEEEDKQKNKRYQRAKRKHVSRAEEPHHVAIGRAITSSISSFFFCLGSRRTRDAVASSRHAKVFLSLFYVIFRCFM